MQHQAAVRWETTAAGRSESGAHDSYFNTEKYEEVKTDLIAKVFKQ